MPANDPKMKTRLRFRHLAKPRRQEITCWAGFRISFTTNTPVIANPGEHDRKSRLRGSFTAGDFERMSKPKCLTITFNRSTRQSRRQRTGARRANQRCSSGRETDRVAKPHQKLAKTVRARRIPKLVALLTQRTSTKSKPQQLNHRLTAAEGPRVGR